LNRFLRSKVVLTLAAFLMIVTAIVISLSGSITHSHAAAAASAPPLGTAATFAVLGAQTVTNTGPTVLTGDLGVSPGTSCTGFPSPCTGGPGIVNGTIHTADAVATTAQADAHTAYANAASQACNTNLTGQDLGGLTLTPGVYCFASSAFLSTGNLTLTLSGTGVFIFQIGSTLITASNAKVLLINGAKAENVFWQVGSSATLGTGTSFIGSILAEISITATTGASSNCGLYALTGAVTLDTNTIGFCSSSQCPPAIGQSVGFGPQWVCPNQRTLIEGIPGSENYSPNTTACTRPIGKSCSIVITNTTNKKQFVTLNGSIVYGIIPGGIRKILYNQAGTYIYSLSSNHSASLTVTVS
jgi:hypothetical protein